VAFFFYTLWGPQNKTAGGGGGGHITGAHAAAATLPPPPPFPSFDIVNVANEEAARACVCCSTAYWLTVKVFPLSEGLVETLARSNVYHVAFALLLGSCLWRASSCIERMGRVSGQL
jgi:hypothetical protein